MRRVGRLGGVVSVCALLLAAPAVSEARVQCYGPYTLADAPVATPTPPAATPTAPFATPTAPYPTPAAGRQNVRHTSMTHQVFVTFDTLGTGADQPWVTFLGRGPGGQEAALLNVGTAADTPSGEIPTIVTTAASGAKIVDTPVLEIYPELHGCTNCSVTVGWCSHASQ